nr:MAG TPA: hypothetical protein [Caudoviricetes sp.]
MILYSEVNLWRTLPHQLRGTLWTLTDCSERMCM